VQLKVRNREKEQKGILLMTGIVKGERRSTDLLCGRAGSIFRSLPT